MLCGYGPAAVTIFTVLQLFSILKRGKKNDYTIGAARILVRYIFADGEINIVYRRSKHFFFTKK